MIKLLRNKSKWKESDLVPSSIESIKVNKWIILVFLQYEEAELIISVKSMEEFSGVFEELFKSGGSVVGKITIDPQL